MPSTRLKKDDRENLLTKLRDGHDLESAGASLGLSVAEVELARGSFGEEVAQAYKTGSSRLRARIMDTALSTDNTSVLLKLLELRDKEAEASDPITLVERVIVQMQSCPHCGKSTADKFVGNPILTADDKEPLTDDNPTPVNTCQRVDKFDLPKESNFQHRRQS